MDCITQTSLSSASDLQQVSELQVEAEQQMQRLDPAAVNRDVQQAADDVGVLGQAAVQTGGGQLHAAQQLLHLGRPLLHQAVDVGHSSAVLNAGWRFETMQRADALHPAVHGPRVGLRTGNTRHFLQLEEREKFLVCKILRTHLLNGGVETEEKIYDMHQKLLASNTDFVIVTSEFGLNFKKEQSSLSAST